VIEAVFDDSRARSAPFEDIQIAHPAIFMVQVALTQTLLQKGWVPELTLGASLGSFAAATLAGCVSVEDALGAVMEQAAIVTRYCREGGMIAVLGDLTQDRDGAILRECEVAAYNFQSHCVLSAQRECLEEIEAHLMRKNLPFQRLPVHYAFHSRWIDAAERPCRDALSRLARKPARIPLVCCAEARILSEIGADHFWSIARRPIRFAATIQHLEGRGAHRYLDVGPADTLATFLKFVLTPVTASQVLSTLSPFGDDLKRLDMLSL
jgi:acyl transferase domain-containing protein